MRVLPHKLAFPREYGPAIFSLLLSLEAFHISSALMTRDSVGLTFLPFPLRDLDWMIWAITVAVSGLFNYLLFRSRSTIISKIGLATVTGAAIVAVSPIVKQFLAEEAARLLGIALMSGAVVAALCFQLWSTPRLFSASTRHVALVFVGSLLSPVLVMQMFMMGSVLPMVRLPRDYVFNTFNLIQGTWARLYPYTVAIFTLLATQPLWMPILAKIDMASPRIDLDSRRTREFNSRRVRTWQYWPLVTLAIGLGIIVSSYRLQTGYSLTGDAHYYFSVLQSDALGTQSILSTDRPLFFLILESVRNFFSVDTEQLLRYLQIFLTGAFVVSTYFIVSSSIKNETLAVLSAFMAAVSPHITIGINYFIIGNWFALILMMLFFAGILRCLETKSRAWAASSVVLSWFMFGIHFPTWAFSILTLFAYMLVCYLGKDPSRHTSTYFFVKVATGCLLVALLTITVGSVSPEMSMSIRDALSKTIAILAKITPLNFIEFLEDNVLLSSYFGYGSYAIPLTYALALLGLYSFYRMRKPATKLVLSWAMVASFGLLLIPKFEHWRLLYMMPLEILAAAGLLYSLTSVGLLEGSLRCRRRMLVPGAILVGNLFVGAMLFLFSFPPLLIALASALLVCFLVYGTSVNEVSHIVAIEIVCLYLLGNVTVALCSLR